MFLLELMLLFVLQCQGISGEGIFIYTSPGQQAVLPCRTKVSPIPTCSFISWLYNRDPRQAVTEVQSGDVLRSSARADRLSVDAECSLVINNITAEDVGFYTCLEERNTRLAISVFLNILTISPSPPDADPERDGEVTLECSLLEYIDLQACKGKKFLWRDETRTELLNEDAGNCVSALTVKRQSGDNMRYTCKLVGDSEVLVEADFTPDFTPDFTGPSPGQTYIIIGTVVGLLVVLVVIAAVFIKCRKRAGVTEGVQKSTQQADEPENNLTYVTVNHANHQASPYKKVKEEVTYSAVKHSGADRSRR